jgi:DNA-binding GntR family transcriptional regulator
VQLNRAAALARALREHRQLLRLCRDGRITEAGEFLVAHIETVRRDLHRLLQPTAAKSKPRKT